MIPYDDLVVALQTWRARQGLAVAQLSGVSISPPPVEVPRTNPPAPPPPKAAATPPPLAPAPNTQDEEFEEGALLEEAHYENEGDDFAMAFNGQPPPAQPEGEDESTSIGNAPGVRDSFGGGGTEPDKGGNSDW
jgi:hypothetical protein